MLRGTPAPTPTPSPGCSEHLDHPLAVQAPSASLLRRRGGWAPRRVAGPVAPVPGRADFPWPSSPSMAPGLPCAPAHRRLPGRGPQRCSPGLPLPSTRASPSDVPSSCLARATTHSGQRSVSAVLGEWPPTPAGPTTSWSPWSPRGGGQQVFLWPPRCAGLWLQAPDTTQPVLGPLGLEGALSSGREPGSCVSPSAHLLWPFPR